MKEKRSLTVQSINETMTIIILFSTKQFFVNKNVSENE